MRRILLGALSALALPSSLLAQVQPPSAITPIAQPAQLPSAHPWYVKPEHGQWMICVKSYTHDKLRPGEDARLSAEALAAEIRQTYKVPAYLFERGSSERQAEAARHAGEIAKKRAEEARAEQEWTALQTQLRTDAAAKGMEFLESKRNVKAARVDIEQQFAVLIGGWPDMASARRELDKIRRWQPPTDKKLMDTQFIVREKDGQRAGEMAFVNPFQTCMVVPNPVAPRQIDAEGEEDTKLLLQINDKEEYSVLKIQKPWTIAVKMYAPPVQVAGKDTEQSLMSRMFKPKPNAMGAAAQQAQDMCKALRSMKPTKGFPYGPYEAYVLHTKYGSMLCVGQFDASDDPKLMTVQEQLGKMTFEIGDINKGQAMQKNVRAFDRLYAMRVKQ